MIRRTTIALGVVLLVACASVAPLPTGPPTPKATAGSARFNFGKTMRIDYFHSGGPGGETVALDGVVSEGAWPGSRTHLIDDMNLGKYFFEVVDRASGLVIYSRGFASIYGEWETTPEFKTSKRAFHESVRFPWPETPVQIVVKKRNRANNFQEIWSTEANPASMLMRETTGDAIGQFWRILENGPPSRKVDILLISEGYSRPELTKFRSDASKLIDALFSLEPFRSRRSDFNISALEIAGHPVSVEYNIFGLKRYMLTYHNRVLRDLASTSPYDVVEILVNDDKYGGGGIFNQQSTVAAGARQAPYVFVHELAHNLAGLGDEYVGNVTYETGGPQTVEPWEPNLTALLDPSRLKWKDLIEPGTPLPTPMNYAGKVGAFEGAGYEARGLYRPEATCIMSAKNLVSFCRVCQRAISRIIDNHTNP
jgi:hypothetical protein